MRYRTWPWPGAKHACMLWVSLPVPQPCRSAHRSSDRYAGSQTPLIRSQGDTHQGPARARQWRYRRSTGSHRQVAASGRQLAGWLEAAAVSCDTLAPTTPCIGLQTAWSSMCDVCATCTWRFNASVQVPPEWYRPGAAAAGATYANSSAAAAPVGAASGFALPKDALPAVAPYTAGEPYSSLCSNFQYLAVPDELSKHAVCTTQCTGGTGEQMRGSHPAVIGVHDKHGRHVLICR